MNIKYKQIIPVVILIFFVFVFGVNAQMENLRAEYDAKLSLQTEAKANYLKVKGLVATDSRRIEGARNVLDTTLDSVLAYMNMFKAKLDIVKPVTGETSIGKLNEKYIQLDSLNKRVTEAKNLDELKKCLTDTKTLFDNVIEECKYIQSRWMLFQTNEAYDRLSEVATELATIVESEELDNTKNSLTNSNTEFKEYYSQLVIKSLTDLNASYPVIQQNMLKYTKVLGDSETSLVNVIQKASE